MAFTTRWSDLLTIVKAQVKDIPTTSYDAMFCDVVSSRMSQGVPWAPQITTIADGQIPLINNQQDYDPPLAVHALGENMYIVRTDVSPIQHYNLDVATSLPDDLVPRSPSAMRAISLQPGVGKLRLECAAQVVTGETWEIRGEYQINPTKITLTSQYCWFDDKYNNVALEMLMYHYMKLADYDEAKVGNVAVDSRGNKTYSGQLGRAMAALDDMKRNEDRANGEQKIFPSDPLGVGKTTLSDYSIIFGV